MNKNKILNELQQIPGVGKSIAEDLWNLNICSIKDLEGKNPEKMYERSCELAGVKIDRCLLYAYRCAVYFASHTTYDTELLKWWNWTDEKMKKRKHRTRL
ncbi:MAG: helix-hairpin-helix domain-containing protein [Ignavibacteriales bacterium]|nr:helix-hairpin-helix domain-containing protein [Ignavibacteriales bacterium]